jgi:TPR repeat protein
MTRVKILIFGLTILCGFSKNLTIQYSIPSNETALIDRYSPFTSNLTEIKSFLELSTKNKDMEMVSKLAEFWLLGYPISKTNPSISSELVENNVFKRNTDLAIKYLKKALNKSSEANYFVTLIYQQSLLIDSFDKYLPATGTSLTTLKSLEDTGMKKMSSMAITASIFNYERCKSAAKFPSFLEDTLSYLFTNSDPKCGYRCEQLANLALKPTTKALEYIFKTGRQSFPVKAINKDTQLFSSYIRTLRKVYGANIENQPNIMDLLLQNYIKDNIIQDINYTHSLNFNSLTQSHDNFVLLNSEDYDITKNFTKALENLYYAKEKGSVEAYAAIGKILITGQGVPVDKKQGLKMLRYAADQGHLESIVILGTYYFIDKNWKEALKYLEIGAQLEDFQSLYYLGVIKLQGLGTKKDCQTALKLFKKVIFKGELGQYAEKGYFMYMFEDYEGAFLYNLISASLGVENSLLSLGYLYENNLVPEKYSCKKGKEYCAAVYYALAYKSPTANHRLANIITKGNDYFSKDYLDALYYYEKSSSLPESLFAIGSMNEYGLGIDMNLTKSEEIYYDIIYKAENGVFDSDSKYPAMLALIRNKAKQNPVFQSFYSIANEIIQWGKDSIDLDNIFN